MKKIIVFYMICCLSMILPWLAENCFIYGSRDFSFGLFLLLGVTFGLYAPLCSFFAWIFYYKGINRLILTRKHYGILYCIFPFLSISIIKTCCNYVGIFSYVFDDFVPIVFIAQNLFIIIYWKIKK